MRRFIYAFVVRTHNHRQSAELLRDQIEKYRSLGLSYDRAIVRLNEVCIRRFGVKYSENNGMWSEHLVFFAALSESHQKVVNILEIGTFRGETTKILADLFPTSLIHSIDLSHDEIKRMGTYAYGASDLPDSKEMPTNVILKIENSLKLLKESNKYDLIWVDGNHKSPYVQIDISNSIRLISDTGFVLCDDVYMKKSRVDKVSGLDSSSTILAFEEAGLIKLSLIRKRLSSRFNNRITGTKFIAVVQRNLL